MRFALLPLLCFVVSAHETITTKLTWSAEISRIVYHRCASCHREGGTAPMALITYDESRPWAKAMRDEVLGRRMPPFGAVKGFGPALRDDMALTQEEITRIAQWVEGGAPEGDPKYLPEVPKPAPAPELPRGRRIRTLKGSAVLLGLKPLEDAASSKIVAAFPDGRMMPLLQLYGYQAKWSRTFVFDVPVPLPAGTRLIAEPAVPLEMLVR